MTTKCSTITLNCRIIKKSKFWTTIRLRESGIILNIMNKDINKECTKHKNKIGSWCPDCERYVNEKEG